MLPSPRIVLVLTLALLPAPAVRADESLLERDVLPVLTKQCLGCHGRANALNCLRFEAVHSCMSWPESDCHLAYF